MKKIYTGEIDKHTSWDGDASTEGLPVAGSSIETFIKDTFGQKAGDFYYDVDNTKYLVFADEEDRELYLSDRESYANLIIGTFDAPAPYSVEINMQTPAVNVILSGTKGNYIDFTFDVKSRTGSSTGESVVATYTFSNAGNIKKVTQIYDAGTNVHFLADQYLSDGVNTISVVVTGRNSLVSSMVGVRYTVVALTLTSTFNFAKAVAVGDYLSIPYYLEGAGVKYIQWYVDGILQEEVDTVSDLKVNRVKNIVTTGMDIGKHSVQARAYITNDNENFYSSTLYYDFVVCPAGENWSTNTTYVLLGATLSEPTEDTITLQAEQYTSLEYQVAVYDSRKRTLELTIADNGTQIQSITTNPDEFESRTYIPATSGTHILSFTAGTASATMTVTVEAGDIDIHEATDGLLLKLSAKGRSNNESAPDTWTYEDITTTFNNFAWNEQSGWDGESLVIPYGTSIDINFAPLNGNPTATGRTIEIDYEVSDIEDEDINILDLTNGTGTGLEMTASTAKLSSSGGAVVNTKYRGGDRLHLAFIINRTSGDDGCMTYIVNNGILERATSFASTDSFRYGGNLHIGAKGTFSSKACTVKLHSVRVYNRALTVEEAFCNYAVDSDNVIDIVNNNDILNDVTGQIDADKVNAKIPVMIITGDISFLLNINNKELKSAWNTYPVDIEFRNLQDPSKNFIIKQADIRLQGTSSISYPRKNFRIYSKSKSKKYRTVMYDAEGNVIEGGLYSFKDSSAPVTCWCLKADYAESSGSHNTGVARLWNSLMSSALFTDGDLVQEYGAHPLRTAAQTWADANDYKYDVRTTIDGFPIVLFQRDSESSAMTCLGQYNFNNDKSTEEVYGFTALSTTDEEGVTHTFDNSKVQCFEFLDSDNAIALFKDVSNFDTGWSDAFEGRYPDGTTEVAALKTLATWINSCKDNQEKWNTEKEDHFDLPKLAAYYVYLMRFGAVDQTVKNAMITTEDGQHWFFINYDNDTILGIDNASHQFDTWDYEMNSRTSTGGYYYAGKGESVLWNCFEADEECINMAKTIDESLYNAGLRYSVMCQMFDDEQSARWNQRIYNENGRYKYILPFQEKGNDVLYMLQGDRRSHRHWWLQHRLEKFDNQWGNGTYKERVIQLRASSDTVIPEGSVLKFIPAVSSYYGYSVASTEVEREYREAGTEVTTVGLPQATGVGNFIYVHNANNIQQLDLSDYISGLAVVDVTKAVNTAGESNLRSLILGDGTNVNSYVTGISGLSAHKQLKELDIRGYQAITNLDLSSLTKLNVFKAANSGLTSFAPAKGLLIYNGSDISLPTTLQSIDIDSMTVSSAQAFDYTPNGNLRYVSMRNIERMWPSNQYAKTFILRWINALNSGQLAQAELILTGINWTNVSVSDVLKLAAVGTKTLRGRISLTSITYEQYQQIIEAFGSNVFDPNGSFIIDAPQGSVIGGPSSLKAGSSGQFTATQFPIAETTVKYLLYNQDQLLPSDTDQSGNVYRQYNGIRLYEDSGIILVLSDISADTTVQVRAQFGDDSYTDYVTFVGQIISYPTSITITGTDTAAIDDHEYIYHKRFVGEYNATLQSITWSATNLPNGTTIIDNTDSAFLEVTNIPTTPVNITITCTAVFEGNRTVSGTKTVSVGLTLPNTFTIDGPNTIDDNDSFSYSLKFNNRLYDPSSSAYTSRIQSVLWSLSQNTPAGITTSGTEYSGSIVATKGNASQVVITLTVIATFTGGREMIATKSIVLDEFDAPVIIDWVDLGLPSGILWRRMNLGATDPEDIGLFYAWGETTGYVDANARNTALGRTDGFSSDAYTATGADAINEQNLSLVNDAANVTLGGSCRMPTYEEMRELIDNCDIVRTTIGGTSGVRFTSKVNGNSIFLPKGGKYLGMSNSGSSACYWSSYHRTAGSNSVAYRMYVDSSNTSVSEDTRCYGLNIRPVMVPPQPVDLGLPSGTLWADMNLGAFSETEAGLYYAWGETTGYKNAAARNAALGRTGGFDSAAYSATGASSIDGHLSASYDAATVSLGGSWRMPSEDDINELCNTNNCTITKETVNGVAGKRFTSVANGNSIFIPFSGYYDGTSLDFSGTYGRYWSSTYYSSSNAYFLSVNSSSASSYYFNRSYGFTVRGVL